MKKILLRAEKIYKKYDGDISVLNNINLILKKGHSIAIMGASGEGKTTLLHILGALESPTSGTIYLNEKKLCYKNAAKIRNSFVGYIFQTYNLLEDLSLLDNILMPAKIGRKNILAIKEKAIDLLKEVNLDKSKHHILAKFLSGGEKQRAAIARSFCNDPEIILADEPSGNLDHKNSKIIHELLISFVKKKNKSLIVATHDENLAKLCDEKFLLSDGTLHII